MADFIEQAFGWDDEISRDSSGWVLLKEGDYPFTVTKFERKYFGGSAKLPPCNQAEMSIEIDGGEQGKVTVQHSLFLHSKTEGLLCQFFLAIGMRKRDERLKMNFPGSIGKTGICHVITETWTGKDGKDHESNRIDRFLDPPEEAASASAGRWKAGAF